MLLSNEAKDYISDKQRFMIKEINFITSIHKLA